MKTSTSSTAGASRLWISLTAAVLVAVYFVAVRPAIKQWGTTGDESTVSLPGDELVPASRTQTTTAITLGAPPREVWPWLIQIGTARGGWYSYDCLDNGCEPSATTILPQYQGLKAGDTIPVSPDGSIGFPVLLLEKNEALGLDLGFFGYRASWVFVLRSRPDDRTRLLVRFRTAYDWWFPGILGQLIFEPIHFFMERKMLIELQKRMPLE